MPRFIRTRYIPSGSLKVADKQSDAVAYLYAGGKSGRLNAIIYYGKQTKSVAFHSYRTEAEREANVRDWFEARRKQMASKAEYAVERATRVATGARFEIGRTYYDRSSCDWDTVYSFKIIERTEKTITIEEHGEVKKRGVYIADNGVECCKPHGTYSMCSVIRADKLTA
jgi:hypothetical protein